MYNISTVAKTPIEERSLNTEQQQAVVFGEGPLLIIAGAGTGKTTVVTERIKYLISSGKAKPAEILALTFTEKASREMEERVDTALPYGMTQMWISTFHSFCDRIIRQEAIHVGLNPAYSLMTEADTIQFFRKHLFSFQLQYFRPLGNPNKFISGMVQHFSRLKDEDISPSQYIAWAKSHVSISNSQTDEEKAESEKYQELAAAYKLYEELKVKEGVADYGDLIANALMIFRTRPNILSQYQNQFKYLLIDEFQDTNFAQNELAVLLAGKRKNITVVGDDDQAIYRWRGAAISNIIQFRKRFPKVKTIVLTKNYRSTKELLDRSHDLVEHNNPDRLEVVEKVDKKLESMRRIEGKQISVIYADRVENEAEAVAEQIVKLQETQPKADRPMAESKYDWKDFAILVRANAHADPFIRAMGRHGVPYQFLGPGQLFRQAEVKDLICYLKLLYNYEDSVAVYRVLSMDVFAVPARDVASLTIFSKKYGVSLFESVEFISGVKSWTGTGTIPVVSDVGAKALTKFVTMVHRHLELVKKETAGQILYYFLQDTGLLQQFTTFKTVKEEKVAANIAKFFDKLKTYEVDHEDASIYAVVDWIELSMSLGESPLASNSDWTENNAVNILTIHSAKGLEFPVVFLINLVSARFPTSEKKEQIPIPDALVKEVLPSGDFHLQEERRLFYVAMTRARDELYFTAAKYYGEGKREKKLSPFIMEAIGEEHVPQLINYSAGTETKQLSLLGWEKTEEKEEAPIVQPIHYLSYSQLESFTTCPLQYKYRYILKIPVPPSAALTFGDTIHKTLQAFYESVKRLQKPTKDALLQLYQKHWSAIGFGNKAYEEKMKSHGEDLLRNFYDHAYDPTIIPLSLEQIFKLSITPSLKLGGKIDRIDELPDGKIEILDYKTGTAPKSRDVRRDQQLSVYALAATDPGLYQKRPEDVIVSFYFLEGQEKVTATRTQEQLDEVKAQVAQKAEEIGKSLFKPTPGKHCDFCEFRLICEAWN